MCSRPRRPVTGLRSTTCAAPVRAATAAAVIEGLPAASGGLQRAQTADPGRFRIFREIYGS